MGLVLVVSDNSATTALLDAVGLESVNRWLDRHDLSSAAIKVGFEDENLGLPLRANQITPAQCLRLLEIVNETHDYSDIDRMLTNNLRNQRLPKRLPDHVQIAHKSGSLNGVVNDIGIIRTDKSEYMLAVLSEKIADTPDFEARLASFSEQIYDLMTDA